MGRDYDVIVIHGWSVLSWGGFEYAGWGKLACLFGVELVSERGEAGVYKCIYGLPMAAGMFIQRDRFNRTINITQPDYIKEMFDTYSMNCETFHSTPMVETSYASSSHANPLLVSSRIETCQVKVATHAAAKETIPCISLQLYMMIRNPPLPL
eukprot:gene376-687_t